jgi:hypothetical protein
MGRFDRRIVRQFCAHCSPVSDAMLRGSRLRRLGVEAIEDLDPATDSARPCHAEAKGSATTSSPTACSVIGCAHPGGERTLPGEADGECEKRVSCNPAHCSTGSNTESVPRQWLYTIVRNLPSLGRKAPVASTMHSDRIARGRRICDDET